MENKKKDNSQEPKTASGPHKRVTKWGGLEVEKGFIGASKAPEEFCDHGLELLSFNFCFHL